jgi:uncharacterized membrane protein YdjX (TVP38/TMEM64 family)
MMSSKVSSRPSHFLWILAIAITFAAVWRLTPLHHRLDLAALVEYGLRFRNYAYAPIIFMGAYLIAGLVVFPHALMIWATGLIFPPHKAIWLCEIGSLVSGFTSYGIGRLLRKDWARRIAGSRLEQITRALKRRGVLALVVLHIFPIVPFSVLNLCAGVAHINSRDFAKGTVLGVTPGVLIVCLLGWRVLNIIHHPTPLDFVLITVFLIAGIFTLHALRKHLLKDAEEIEG